MCSSLLSLHLVSLDRFGYDTPGLYPFYYSPLHNTHYVSRGSTGDATINAYTMYGVYGLSAVTSIGAAGLMIGGTFPGGSMSIGVFCGGGGGVGCGGGGGM